MKHRRTLDSHDRDLIFAKVGTYPHLYNPVTGQIASPEVNVADSIEIGEKMEREFVASLPDGFYNAISSSIKTMFALKGQAKGTKNRPVVDLETIVLRLLMIGQQRKIELGPLFAYELCAVPPALIDGQGCLRKGNKSSLVKRLGVVDISPKPADTLIADVSQLFYHMIWPHGGIPSQASRCRPLPSSSLLWHSCSSWSSFAEHQDNHSGKETIGHALVLFLIVM